jgi:hypothetical protein
MLFFRLRREPLKIAPDPADMPILRLEADPALPISVFALNNLSANAKRRLYRTLLAAPMLAEHGIDPLTWRSATGESCVTLEAEPGSHTVRLAVRKAADADPFIRLEIGDNHINGFDLQFIALEDPSAERVGIDRDGAGRQTHLGTVSRNLGEEQRALRAGLSPGQTRRGSGSLRRALAQVESFMSLMAHAAYSLEPLTYTSAWLFERHGFAYARGHRLMDEIHAQFQPAGALHRALDGSSAFRQPEQAGTVRGRAWAIHDGVLAAIGKEWGSLRMVKQLGRHAGVETFPGAVF